MAGYFWEPLGQTQWFKYVGLLVTFISQTHDK